MSGVLVVENNLQIRTMYIAGLTGFGYEIVDTPSLRQAIQHLEAGFEPMVVLLDLDLDDGSGIELIQYIRETMMRQDIGIIVTTGMRVPPEELTALGADRLLTKPVDLIDLLNTIQAYNH